MAELKLTSVKVDDELFEEFKIASIRSKFNLQKLVNRCMDLYIKDEEFARKIHSHTDLTPTNNNL